MRSGRLSFYAVFLLCLMQLFSCSSGVEPAEVVCRVAKQSYDYLLEGRFEEFVDCHYQPDSIPASYREQLIANVRMFVAQQKSDHGGMVKVDVIRAEVYTALHSANAFLSVQYGDSTCEEILVPMVERESVWYLR